MEPKLSDYEPFFRSTRRGLSGKMLATCAWIALFGVCILPCMVPFACRREPSAILARIPVGSKLSELDKYLETSSEGSNVQEWSNSRTATRSTKYMKSKHGFSYVRELGEYDVWTASKSERDKFTGNITFHYSSWFMHDDLLSNYVVSLVYVNGVLKEKDYGVLPG